MSDIEEMDSDSDTFTSASQDPEKETSQTIEKETSQTTEASQGGKTNESKEDQGASKDQGHSKKRPVPLYLLPQKLHLGSSAVHNMRSLVPHGMHRLI